MELVRVDLYPLARRLPYLLGNARFGVMKPAKGLVLSPRVMHMPPIGVALWTRSDPGHSECVGFHGSLRMCVTR
jgi:hypothetical protein